MDQAVRAGKDKELVQMKATNKESQPTKQPKPIVFVGLFHISLSQWLCAVV